MTRHVQREAIRASQQWRVIWFRCVTLPESLYIYIYIYIFIYFHSFIYFYLFIFICLFLFIFIHLFLFVYLFIFIYLFLFIYLYLFLFVLFIYLCLFIPYTDFCLLTHCRCRGLLLQLITLSNIQLVGLLWTRDRPVADTSTYTIYNTQKRQPSIPRWDSNVRSQQANGHRPTP